LYGDVLYYAIAAIEVYESARPERYYFWVCFVLLNSFWIFIPGYLLYSGFVEVVEVFKRDAPRRNGKEEQRLGTKWSAQGGTVIEASMYGG